MVDITNEVTQILTSEFAAHMRDPMRKGLAKVSRDLDVDIEDDLNIIGNFASLSKKPDTGPSVVKAFVDAATAIRSEARISGELDLYLSRIVQNYSNTSDGSIYRYNIGKALDSLANGVNHPTEWSTYKSIREVLDSSGVYILAGNDDPMFMTYEHTHATDYGVQIVCPEGGISSSFALVFDNLLTGDTWDIPVIGSGSDLPFTGTITIGDNNEISEYLDPGYLKISIRYYGTEPSSPPYIQFDACRFGNNEPGPDPNLSFEVDLTRFDPSDAKLYSTRGDEIGVVTMGSGTVADNVYTVQGGLHVTGLTFVNIGTELLNDERWTIEFEVKDYVFYQYNTVNWFFNCSKGALETASISDFNSHAIHSRMKSSTAPTLYNYCAAEGDEAFYDFATEPSMIYGFPFRFKWVNDGTNISMWVNGLKKASVPSSAFRYPIDRVGSPNSGNTAGSNSNTMTLSYFKVSKSADTTNNRVLYKWHITKFKAYEDWFTVKRFKLYTANDELIDQNEDNYVCIFTNNGTSQDGVQNNESLAYLLLAKAQSDGVYHDHGYIYRPNHTVDGDVIDVIYSVPSSLPAVNAYSYVAPFDGGNIFDFTAWANVVKTYTVQGTNGIRKGNGAWSDNGFTMVKADISGWMSTLSTLNTLGDTSKVPTISLPYYMSQNKPYVLRFHVTSNVVNPRITVLIKAGNTNTTISDTEPTIDANGNVYVTFNTTERSISICFGANDFVQDNYATISDIVLTDETFSMRQPVSWTFQKSTDGGETWTTLDTRSDVAVPYRGLETSKFILL